MGDHQGAYVSSIGLRELTLYIMQELNDNLSVPGRHCQSKLQLDHNPRDHRVMDRASACGANSSGFYSCHIQMTFSALGYKGIGYTKAKYNLFQLDHRPPNALIMKTRLSRGTSRPRKNLRPLKRFWRRFCSSS